MKYALAFVALAACSSPKSKTSGSPPPPPDDFKRPDGENLNVRPGSPAPDKNFDFDDDKLDGIHVVGAIPKDSIHRVVRENFSTDAYKGGQFFFDGVFTSPASNSSSTLRNAFGRDLAAFLLGVPTTGSGGNASQIDNSINYSVQSLYHGMFF